MRSLAIVLTLLLAAMLGAIALRLERAGADAPLNAVYFAGATPVIDRAELRAAGVRMVSSFAAFQSAAATADVIIVDRETMLSVDHDWLVEQLRQAKFIVGLNIPIVALSEYAGYDRYASGLGGYLQGYGGQPFYSYFYYREEPRGARYSGSGSDRLYSNWVFLGLLRNMAEYATNNHTPTRSPSNSPAPTRPRP